MQFNALPVTGDDMRIFICALLCIPFVLSHTCLAMTSIERGREIAVEADKRASNYGDLTANMEMVLRDSGGRESKRLIRIKTMETPADGDKSLTIFDSPGDVRGTALLIFSHKAADDDQWLYLPALKRVKRISAHNKSSPFMGSEFAYEDLSSLEVEKYTYAYLGEEQLDDHKCFVVVRFPKDTENSGYSRIISWLDQAEYRTWKEEYYDRKKRLLKTLTVKNYQLYQGTLWKAHWMRMVNHQKGKETDLLWSNFTFKSGLTDRDFDQNSLKRAK